MQQQQQQQQQRLVIGPFTKPQAPKVSAHPGSPPRGRSRERVSPATPAAGFQGEPAGAPLPAGGARQQRMRFPLWPLHCSIPREAAVSDSRAAARSDGELPR